MQNDNSSEFLKSINIIYFALLAGQIMFLMVAFFVAKDVVITKQVKEMNNLFQFIVPVYAIGGIAMGYLISKSLLKKIDKKASLDEKLNKYRAALLVKFALHEVPVIFALVVYLISKNNLYLGIALVTILLFLFIRPGRDAIIQDLELNSQESRNL
jgi:hypothetical protein